MARQYIYQMQGLTRRLGTGRELLSNIWLSFYPGAKIGIIGANGAGKSTLLRIMAGVDTDIEGTVWRDPDARVGYLRQEPQLDPALDVRGNVEQGVARGEVSERHRPEVLADLLLGGVTTALTRWCADDGYDLESGLADAARALNDLLSPRRNQA